MEDMNGFKSNIIQESVTCNHAFSYDSPSDCTFIWWTCSYLSRLTSSSIHNMLLMVQLLMDHPRSAHLLYLVRFAWASQVPLVVKNLPASAADIRGVGSIPGLGRSPGGEHGNSLQYSCLENPMDRGDGWAVVHRITQRWVWLKQLNTHTHTHTRTEETGGL